MAETLKRTIGVGTAWMSVSTIILKIVGLATIFIMLRKLNVYEYGLAELVLSVIGIFSLFSLPGLGQMIIADMGIAKGKGDLRAMKELFVNYFYIQLSLGIVAWAIVFFGSNIIAHYFSEHAGGLFKIVSFAFLISPFRTLFVTAFSVELKFFHRSLYSVLEEVFKLVIIWVLLYLVGLRVGAVIWAVVLSQFFVMIPMAGTLLRTTRYFRSVTLTNRKAPWTLLYDHGKWGVFASYFNSLGQHVRTWIIKVMLGTEAVGIFAVAAGLLAHTNSLFSVATTLSPILPQYVSDKKRFFLLITKGIKYQLALSIGMIFLGLTLVPIFVSILFPQYIDSLILYKILLVTLIPSSFATIYTSVFYALRAQKNYFVALFVRNISIAFLLPTGIYFFGIMGVVFEVIITLVLFTITRYFSLKKLMGYKIEWKNFFSYDDADKLIVKGIKFRFSLLIKKIYASN